MLKCYMGFDLSDKEVCVINVLEKFMDSEVRCVEMNRVFVDGIEFLNLVISLYFFFWLKCVCWILYWFLGEFDIN